MEFPSVEDSYPAASVAPATVSTQSRSSRKVNLRLDFTTYRCLVVNVFSRLTEKLIHRFSRFLILLMLLCFDPEDPFFSSAGSTGSFGPINSPANLNSYSSCITTNSSQPKGGRAALVENFSVAMNSALILD